MRKPSVLCALLTVAVMAVAYVSAQPGEGQLQCSVRDVPEQVVLYTLHRGPYGAVGPPIGKLFGLAGQKGITPRGSISFVYLNNPELVSQEHWLTEIRMPVGEDALKLAGTLGEFTDVKRLPAMETAVLRKPRGIDDAGAVRERLYAWMRQQGYAAADACGEVFLSHAAGGDYSEMETEIFVPVEKVALGQD